MNNEGLGSWPERRLRMSPESEAVVFEGERTTYAQLAERCRRAANALRVLGVGRGDRVAYLGENHPAVLETLFGAGQLGAVWVAVNARLAADEVQFVLNDSGASVVVHTAGLEPAPDLKVCCPTVRHWIPLTAKPEGWDALLSSEPPDALDERVSLDDLCLLMYTSGTTGRPKGVMLTHANMTWNAINQAIGLETTSAERTLALAPLFHIGGLGGSVTPTIMHGGTVVILPRFDADVVLRLVEAERVTSFFAPPTVIDMLRRHPSWDTTDLSSLRTISVAGAPLPEELIGPWLDRGVAVQQAYGMTESAPSATILASSDARLRLGSAGKMSFFTDVQVFDANDAPVGPGEIGEVRIKGPNVMAGYWNNPEATDEALVGGWLHTGDAATLDEDGYLYIRDRYKDMFISGGENVYPAEVERVLRGLPGVADAAVIGVPDALWGEVGWGYVVAEPGDSPDPEQVRRDARLLLAGFKVPAKVRIVEALPRTASGKVNKPELRRSALGTSAE